MIEPEVGDIININDKCYKIVKTTDGDCSECIAKDDYKLCNSLLNKVGMCTMVFRNIYKEVK